VWWNGTVTTAYCAPQYIQVVIDGLVDDSGTSLLGVCSGGLALVELVQSTISLTLLALLAPAAVASGVCIWEWCKGGLTTNSNRLIGTTPRWSLVEIAA
jgi:hypothetical protein